MSAHVMCLTSSGGIPLFSRQKGDSDMITFSKIASLNGVHMFLKSQDVTLLSTDLPDVTVAWKEFEQCIILIAIASGVTKYVLDRFLDATFGAMVLFAGIDEIKNTKNVERLKKDMRLCSPIIDRLMDCLNVGDKIAAKTDMINMTECIISSESHLLQTCLEGFMECLDSMYGCVLVHGCVAAATEGWWSLDSVERKLLTTAIASEIVCTTRDIPVFLPRKSPNVAFRLVSVTLINHVEVLALCGPNPELTEIERFAVQCWKSNMDALCTIEQSYPRNLPTSISLDSETLGFLLANYKTEKFVLGRNSQCAKNRATGSHRLDILRTFYHQAVETFALSAEHEESGDERATASTCKFIGAKETYLCSEYHKCHAVKHGDNILCVLYTSAVPTHTMRLISQKIVKMIFSDKQTYW
ncbi:PREDICTED: protein fuzzy homolog [Vollenhovia emeryi]|uniref:protein fuzzy homolog n=1 Tax=Vollenhovia emeryi TaxID=411798 RepID=UPI0005F55E8C|nr:PREDICTED: protein fuzzy homolog [Vollenhovia emeryi]XP_011878904.1 PREDICTED: protein fuzzy homolog [Vollenhovia emeryi]XP_011878905.1 PREDICTED: protein fuzzy homolog [Vollenhovia emeryi]XP_011878906.1 PREDICTED: protein fuzzy homolog [Vollenhovia emeryi]XP_011878907.1 PREDICTED: protein fuzzy homolog [Vollenhovia emeryi]